MIKEPLEYMDELATPIVDRLDELCNEYCRVKYYLARWIYAMRTEKPVAQSIGVPYGDIRDWENKFEQLFYEKYDTYLKRAKEDGIRDRVRKFETEQYGWSELEQ